MNNKTEVNKQLLWAGIIVLFISLIFNIGQILRQHALRSSIDRFVYGISVAENDADGKAAFNQFVYETNSSYNTAGAWPKWMSRSPVANFKSWFGGGQSSPKDVGRCNAEDEYGNCTDRDITGW